MGILLVFLSVDLPTELIRWCQIPWNRNNRQLWATIWGLGTEVRSSGRAIPSASPQHIYFTFNFFRILNFSFIFIIFHSSLTTPNSTSCSSSCLKQTKQSVYESKTNLWNPIYTGNCWALGQFWGVFAVRSVTALRKQLSITYSYLARCRAFWPLPLLHAGILSGLSSCRSRQWCHSLCEIVCASALLGLENDDAL